MGRRWGAREKALRPSETITSAFRATAAKPVLRLEIPASEHPHGQEHRLRAISFALRTSGRKV